MAKIQVDAYQCDDTDCDNSVLSEGEYETCVFCKQLFCTEHNCEIEILHTSEPVEILIVYACMDCLECNNHLRTEVSTAFARKLNQ